MIICYIKIGGHILIQLQRDLYTDGKEDERKKKLDFPMVKMIHPHLVAK